MLLKDKKHVIEWLRLTQLTSLNIVDQMKKLDIPEGALNRDLNLAKACNLIATHLENTEEYKLEKKNEN